MAQPVKHPTSAQVTISQFVGSSPASGPEPASDSVSPSVSAPLALCLSQINTHEKKNKVLFKKINK